MASFYTVNEKIKITCETNDGSVVNHEADLLKSFGKDIVHEINNERAAQSKLVTTLVIPSRDDQFHIETSHFICQPNKLIGFYMRLQRFLRNSHRSL